MPNRPTRAYRLVPEDPDAFVTRLYERLRGTPYRLGPSWRENEVEAAQHNHYEQLASVCVEYLQLEEATGDRPELVSSGLRSKFKYHSGVLSGDPDAAWKLYGDHMHALLADDTQP